MTKTISKTRKDERVGMRVEIAPHYDLWMRGARFGVVRWVVRDYKPGRDLLYLEMDHPQVKRQVAIWADEVSYQ